MKQAVSAQKKDAPIYYMERPIIFYYLKRASSDLESGSGIVVFVLIVDL